MFVDVVSIKCGWGLREETVDACAARLSRMAEALADIYPSLAALRWSGVGHQVSTRVVSELARAGELARLFKRQRVYDSSRKLIVTDGYRFEASGQSEDGRPIVLSVHAGNGADLPDKARSAGSPPLPQLRGVRRLPSSRFPSFTSSACRRRC